MTLKEYSTILIRADGSFQSLALRSTHDYHHVQRVRLRSTEIQSTYNPTTFLVEVEGVIDVYNASLTSRNLSTESRNSQLLQA